MDQRRLLSFILASTAFFFFYILMLKNFGVPPKPNPAQDAAQVDGDGPAKDGAIDGLVADGDAKADGDPDKANLVAADDKNCLLYTSPSPRDGLLSRMPSSA